MYTFECTGDDYCYYTKLSLNGFNYFHPPHPSGFCELPICRTPERCSAVMLKQDVKYSKDYDIILKFILLSLPMTVK